LSITRQPVASISTARQTANAVANDQHIVVPEKSVLIKRMLVRFDFGGLKAV